MGLLQQWHNASYIIDIHDFVMLMDSLLFSHMVWYYVNNSVFWHSFVPGFSITLFMHMASLHLGYVLWDDLAMGAIMCVIYYWYILFYNANG